MSEQQRVALVTGGTRGLGAAIVRQLAADNIRVAFTYVQSKDLADAVADEFDAVAIRADNGDPEEIEAAVRQVVEKFGRLDILVNNAAVADFRPLAEVPLASFDRQVAVNLRGPWVAIQAASPYLGDGGRVVNVGTIFAERLPPGTNAGVALYSMTKSGLTGMTRALARELGPRGITVNAVQPGLFDTGPVAEEYREYRENMQRLTPMGIGTPAEVASMIRYLVSPEARFVTGATITVDGGFSA